MKQVLPRMENKLNRNHTRKKWWKRLVWTMGSIVVFCTTYALILPAITMEQKPVCGLEVHEHTESCYVQETVPTLACDLEETQEHVHTDTCWIQTEQLVSTLVCDLEESEEHTHADACWTQTEQSISTLGCGLKESEGHTHADACWTQTEQLVSALGCGLEETEAHTHAEVCWIQTEQAEPVLVCALQEHKHEESCYPAEEENSGEYICGSGVHAHAETCYDETGKLLCTIPEHAHEASCLVEDLDLTADVETAAQWESEINKLTMTGNWPTDVLTVAESQLDYRESAKNVYLDENGDLKGYTRYGDWYGDPYGDWCAMYAAFCLDYAGVEEVPYEAVCNTWIEALTEKELYYTAEAYTPKPGDLIFFDFDQKRDAIEEIPVRADHVGFVVELIPATNREPARIKTIEGNSGNKVAYQTYEMDDPAIIGYGKIPAGEMIVLAHQGTDYNVTVSFGPEANIPETAQLLVDEIVPGTEAYEAYYKQSVEELLRTSEMETEDELAVSFARFFDIRFVVDGQIIEPTAAVNVQISYNEGIDQAEGKSGVAVHFAKDGIEVLDAETTQDASAGENRVDTFEFVQESFSVVGTMVSSYSRAIGVTTATTVDFNSLNTASDTQYVLYTEYNGQYYAITAKTGDVTGYAIPVTVNNNGTISWENSDTAIFWSFERNGNTGNSYYVQNFASERYLHAFDNSTPSNSDYGTTTGGRNPSTLTRQNNGTFIAQGNRYYTGISVVNGTVTFTRVQNANDAARFYLAQVGNLYNVWFDGTNGGMMSYYGADDLNIPVVRANNGPTTIELPETWKSSTKYAYKLRGWYDINTHTYYPVNPDDDEIATAQIRQDTVFYADWIAATYNVGKNNAHVVDSLDTSDFITTHVFDYNVLFNVMSQTHRGTITDTDHTETWTLVDDGTVPYQNGQSLGFSFVDYDADGEFSYALERDTINTNQGDAITAGILQDVYNRTGKNLLDILFNPATDDVIGKYHVGTGNYLFQYMDSTTDNYDGEHDGYYYLDARLNAASYSTDQGGRFYLYDYLERTSDSQKDGHLNPVGQYSDFLPFNSPDLFDANQLNEYTDSVRRPGYEYDAKDGDGSYTEYNSPDDATTNYFFGIRSDIEFFLPNDSGITDEYGNYGNVSTRGQHMVFDFHGDDDVWVFIDGELVLDIGGLHGIMHGEIDFSTGTVTSGKDGAAETVRSFRDILGHNITEGTHTMTVYYMERGSSQSNCAIYFNIAPRYDLVITKEDVATAEALDGAVFSIFTDEAMQHSAELWTSFEAHENGEAPTNTFKVVNGEAKCWGISAGKSYYIYETTPPPGYPASDDLIRITLNNRGTAAIETTTLHGSNGYETEGFGVIYQSVNDTLKIVALTVTNQKDGDHTEVRVEKIWDESSVDIPQSITVILTADGVPVGRRAILNEGNGWSYTWTGLDKFRAEGIEQEIVYGVQEVLVPGYATTQGEFRKVDNYTDWIRVDQMSDSKTYLLVHNGQALTYNGSRFGWMDPTDAEADTSLSAQWAVTTDHDGFHLKNGLGYTLTYSGNRFSGTLSDAVNLNQVFYYLNSRLVVHDHDVYYQFGANGSAVSDDGLAFTLLQKETMTGFLTNITNVPVDEENQTYVEVNKVWNDGNDQHAKDSVIIHLYADGEDTGSTVTLNAENNWRGGFYDLPYYQADRVVQYTVVEESVYGYIPEYSDLTELPGIPVDVWREVSRLEANKVYMFTVGGNALSLVDGTVTAEPRDTTNESQYWKVVSRGNNLILQNMASKSYLVHSNSSLSMTTNQNNATQITLSGGHLNLNGVYLELGFGYANVTSNSANASAVSVLTQMQITGRPGVGYTVTNNLAMYELPNTGGMGIFLYTLGGLLLLAAVAWMHITVLGRKRQKGGGYHNT